MLELKNALLIGLLILRSKPGNRLHVIVHRSGLVLALLCPIERGRMCSNMMRKDIVLCRDRLLQLCHDPFPLHQGIIRNVRQERHGIGR